MDRFRGEIYRLPPPSASDWPGLPVSALGAGSPVGSELEPGGDVDVMREQGSQRRPVSGFDPPELQAQDQRRGPPLDMTFPREIP